MTAYAQMQHIQFWILEDKKKITKNHCSKDDEIDEGQKLLKIKLFLLYHYLFIGKKRKQNTTLYL